MSWPVLDRIKREFNAMTPCRLMAHERDATFPWSDPKIQQALVAILTSPLNPALPPDADYTRSLVKNFISMFEKRDIEVSDELYAVYVRFAGATREENIHRTFWLTPDVQITLCERREFISNGTTGLTTWQAGPALIEWLLQDGRWAALVPGRTVLELGSGTGLLGMAACKLFAPHKVYLTDSHEDVLATLQHNAAINGLADCDQLSVACVDWTCVNDDFLVGAAADVVLAADVVYDRALFPGLVRTLETLLARRTCTALIACTVRNAATLAEFVGCLDAVGIAVEAVPLVLGTMFTYDDYTEVTLLRCSAVPPTTLSACVACPAPV